MSSNTPNLIGLSKEEKYKAVKEYVHSQGDTLLTKKFEKGPIRLYVKCGKHKIKYRVDWSNYRKNSRCPKCGIEKMKKSKTLTFKQTKKDIERKFSHLTVIGLVGKNASFNNKAEIWMKCDKGHPKFKSNRKQVMKSQKGLICEQCRKNNHSDVMSLTYDDVSRSCKKLKLRLLTRKFKGLDSRVRVQCIKCDHRYRLKVATIRTKQTLCKRCNQPDPEKCVDEVLQLLKHDKIIKYYRYNPYLSYYYKSDPKCKDIRECPFDFIVFLPNMKTFVIEVDGDQHFNKRWFINQNKPENWEGRKRRDAIKNNHCVNNKITLLRIHENDTSNSKKYIESIIENINNKHINPDIIYCSNKKKYRKMFDRMKKEKYQKLSSNSLKKAK